MRPVVKRGRPILPRFFGDRYLLGHGPNGWWLEKREEWGDWAPWTEHAGKFYRGRCRGIRVLWGKP